MHLNANAYCRIGSFTNIIIANIIGIPTYSLSPQSLPHCSTQSHISLICLPILNDLLQPIFGRDVFIDERRKSADVFMYSCLAL